MTGEQNGCCTLVGRPIPYSHSVLFRYGTSTHTLTHTHSRTETYILHMQLAANGNSNTTIDGFPVIRWAQTANYGYVPNARMKRVFMAVTMDLGDPTSPYGSIHPRDKQDVGARLALAGRAVAYNDASIYYTGPIAKQAKLR